MATASQKKSYYEPWNAYFSEQGELVKKAKAQMGVKKNTATDETDSSDMDDDDDADNDDDEK